MRVTYLIQVSIATQAWVYGTNTKRKCALDVSFWSLSRIKLTYIARILSVSTRWMSHSGLNRESRLSVLYEWQAWVHVAYLILVLTIENQAWVYCTNNEREWDLHISLWFQSRIKLECMVRILSVGTRWMSYPGLNSRESSLSVLYEY